MATASGGSLTSDDDAVRSLQYQHWPHADERCRQMLDVDSIEGHAIHILARGMRAQRLVAFVGAGVSMAYGRMTWSSFTRHLYEKTATDVEKLSKIDPGHIACQVWARTCLPMWKDAAAFNRAGDHPAKAQTLAIVRQLLNDPGLPLSPQANSIHDDTKALLKDTTGFGKHLIESVYHTTAPTFYAEAKTGLAPGRGLKGVLAALDNPDAAAAAQQVKSALAQPSQEKDSPLRLLALEWGIRRFLTTNYDGEIERALKDLLFQPRERPPHDGDASGGAVHANQLVVRTFDAHETGRSVAFAVEGPRRHAAVMHLHGRAVDEPGASAKSLVVTEADYQHLYVDDHPARDLVTNASTANFAANPVLFLGSDMSEADVMRPMRLFITGQGHRRDRMAVALFAATKARDERVRRQVNLLQTYGIYAIFYGQADTGEAAASDGGPPELWLTRLWQAWAAFEQAADGDRSNLELAKKAQQQFELLLKPSSIEGQAFDATNDFRPELARLREAVRTMTASSIDARLRAQFEITRDWITSLFLCAKLVWLHREAVDAINIDARPLPPYMRPGNDLAAMVAMQSWSHLHHRHRVLAAYPGFIGRFDRPVGQLTQEGSAARPADDGVQALCDDIESAKDFRRFDGRRVVVACAARGQGKGAQSDRLIAPRPGTVAGSPGPGCQGLPVEELLSALGGYPDADRPGYGHVLHVNLSFSNEVGTIIGQLAALLHDIHVVRFRGGVRGSDDLWPAPCSDQLEELGRGLTSLGLRGPPVRLLVVLGNAGVLFDADGRPKNGQIARTLRVLLSKRFLHIPLDLLMYVGESQVPRGLRMPKPDGKAERSSELGLSLDEAMKVTGEGTSDRVLTDQRRRRRLDRLNIRMLRDKATLFVHPLARTRLIRLAASHFPGLAEALGWVRWSAPAVADHAGDSAAATNENKALTAGRDGKLAPRGTREDSLARHLHQAAGGSRFALTLLLAWLDAQRTTPEDEAGRREERARLERLCDEVLAAFDGPPSGSMVETAIEFVLDRWASMHALGTPMHESACPKPMPDEGGAPNPAAGPSNALYAAMHYLVRRPSAASWRLATELLWHLAAFSHPVEASVLCACRGVWTAAGALTASAAKAPSVQHVEDGSNVVLDTSLLIRAMLELLAHWCLVFRISERPLNEQLFRAMPDRAERVRYAPHRHMERHWVRLMGGRNVETTHWDQFTTTMYASLPDEAPVLRQAAHRELTGVLKTLTGYPVPPGDPAFADTTAAAAGDGANDIDTMVRQADRIRAAYYLVRTTYSLGVVAHLAPHNSDAGTRCGHMEQYRRLVRWITHAARYWDHRYKVSEPDSLLAGRSLSDQPIKPGQAWNGVEASRCSGIFYPGELTWLYAESGVISLAQGKLQDAEHLLTLAEATCRMVEADDAGSLHARVRLHTAYVQFERGRPDRAKQILSPIASRLNGHPVPPLIANYYLGLIEHIGGNYLAARERYDTAFDGLTLQRRARATAFVLVNLADLIRVTEPTHFKEAVAKSDLAISLAQQGGHEDLRVLATLGKIRLHVEAGSHMMTELFEELHHAERYAARMDNPRIANEVHDLRARYLYQQGEYRLSAQDATLGLEIAALYDMKLRKARGLLTLARIMWKRGELSSADSLVKMGRELAASCDYYTCVRGFKELELMLQRTVGPRAAH